jgi:hypothetical protein
LVAAIPVDVAQENAGKKRWPALIRGPDVFVNSYDVGEVYHRGFQWLLIKSSHLGFGKD